MAQTGVRQAHERRDLGPIRGVAPAIGHRRRLGSGADSGSASSGCSACRCTARSRSCRGSVGMRVPDAGCSGSSAAVRPRALQAELELHIDMTFGLISDNAQRYDDVLPAQVRPRPDGRVTELDRLAAATGRPSGHPAATSSLPGPPGAPGSRNGRSRAAACRTSVSLLEVTEPSSSQGTGQLRGPIQSPSWLCTSMTSTRKRPSAPRFRAPSRRRFVAASSSGFRRTATGGAGRLTGTLE